MNLAVLLAGLRKSNPAGSRGTKAAPGIRPEYTILSRGRQLQRFFTRFTNIVVSGPESRLSALGPYP